MCMMSPLVYTFRLACHRSRLRLPFGEQANNENGILRHKEGRETFLSIFPHFLCAVGKIQPMVSRVMKK